MPTIKYRKAAQKFLKTLGAKQKRQLSQKIDTLVLEPYPYDSKKLKGYSGYRVTCGEFRIIYEVDNEILEIVSIAKRNDDDSYKFLHRFFIL